MKKNNTVMIIDAGGRGAALVHAYSKSSYVSKIICIPGNDLMKVNTKKKVVIYPHLKTTSVKEILKIAQKEKVALVDVAQDNAVEAGVTNALQKAGITVSGPTKEAGQIEWDKAWSRNFMVKYKLPVPQFIVCKSEKEGIDFIKNRKKDRSWFIKAYGLVEGKGALPAQTNAEAIERIKEMKRFGQKGSTYLIEEWLTGEEFSSFALVDGKSFQIIGHAQDHKRVFNGDEGENTGGMGACTPPLLITKKIEKQIYSIFKQTAQGLKKEGRLYKGILYLGGIVVNGIVFIIEFNARWGDPEAEVLVPSITNDLFLVSMGVANGKLNTIKVRTDTKARVVVAGCSRGYPADYSNVKGKEIFGLNKVSKMNGILIYSAGIKKIKNKYIANGGRLFYVVAEGKHILDVRRKAYDALSGVYIQGNNLHYRTDIGWRDVERFYNKGNKR